MIWRFLWVIAWSLLSQFLSSTIWLVKSLDYIHALVAWVCTCCRDLVNYVWCFNLICARCSSVWCFFGLFLAGMKSGRGRFLFLEPLFRVWKKLCWWQVFVGFWGFRGSMLLCWVVGHVEFGGLCGILVVLRNAGGIGFGLLPLLRVTWPF